MVLGLTTVGAGVGGVGTHWPNPSPEPAPGGPVGTSGVGPVSRLTGATWTWIGALASWCGV